MNDKILVFKSTPENWEKEYKGIKKGTMRRDDGGPRFVMLREWMKSKEYGYVVMERTTDKMAFIEPVSDVTAFEEDVYDISWR